MPKAHSAATAIVITQRYAHLAPEVSRDAVQLLDATSERPAPERPALEQAAEKSPDVRGQRPARERSTAKNRQKTLPDPLSS